MFTPFKSMSYHEPYTSILFPQRTNCDTVLHFIICSQHNFVACAMTYHHSLHYWVQHQYHLLATHTTLIHNCNYKDHGFLPLVLCHYEVGFVYPDLIMYQISQSQIYPIVAMIHGSFLCVNHMFPHVVVWYWNYGWSQYMGLKCTYIQNQPYT